MKTLSAYGLIDLADDWNLGPNGPVEPSPMEIAAAEAEWNAPPAAYVRRGRSPRPPVPPMPAQHVAFLERVAVLINKEMIAERSLERADARLLWCAGVRKEAAPGLVAQLLRACDGLVAAGEVAADDCRLAALRAIRVEPSPGMWSQL